MTQSTTPGPGQYEPPSTIGKDAPLISMKGRNREPSLIDSPGPGTYDANEKGVKSSLIGYRLGTSTRDQSTSKSNKAWVPGPGSYEQGNLIGRDAPSISIRGKTSMSIA
jgi:Sperm-tail PG-rich repeat